MFFNNFDFIDIIIGSWIWGIEVIDLGINNWVMLNVEIFIVLFDIINIFMVLGYNFFIVVSDF